MLRKWSLIFMALSMIFPSLDALEQAKETAKETPSIKEPLKEITSQTKHSITIDGNTINYIATAGNYIIKDEKNNTSASIFFVAYTKEDVNDISTRPLTFAFNGGPGSSAIWLHIGAFGPMKIALTDEGTPLLPPHLEKNEQSLLDVTDLVFIDPVATGYSRAAPGEDQKKYFNVEEDVKSIAEFIRLYTTRNNRWTSPKFLAGESYGTTRATMLVHYLQEHDKMNVDGIILISSILDYAPYFTNTGNDLPFITFLPTYTAAAWYHKKLKPEYQQDLKKALADAEYFASHDYTIALGQGDRLSQQQRKEIANKLSDLTSIPAKVFLANDLRLPPSRYSKELLREDNRIVGRFDARIEGIDFDEGASMAYHDPVYGIFGPFTAAFNNYLRNDLKVEKDENYEVLLNIEKWDYSGVATNQYLNVTDDLKQAMSKNKNLRVYVASGLYDLATPYYAGQYVLNHMNLDPSLRGNVQNDRYDSGHMIFIHKDSLVRLKKQISAFIKNAQKATTM